MLKFISIICTLSLLGACANTVDKETRIESEHDKPNVVMIFIDDMGYGDISAFGNDQVPTPHIDRLAKEGQKFTNFYVNSPICSPSRVALKTGVYPHRERINSFLESRKNNAQRNMADFMSAERLTYAKLFQQAGYATAHFGKWHIGGGRDVDNAPLPKAYGYDESLVSFEGLGNRILWQKHGNQRLSWQYSPDKGQILSKRKHQTTETYVDKAIDFIQRHKGQPFLVNMFPNDVHDAHMPSEAKLEKWQGKGRHIKEDKFFAVLDEMDRQIGRLLNAIDEAGLANNTIVMLTSDNGPTDWGHYYKLNMTPPPGFTGPFFGRKWSLYEGGIRMPFLIRWPSKIKAGIVNNNTWFSAIDILPSLAVMADLKLPANVELDGEDMSKALIGGNQIRSKPLFWEYGVYPTIRPGLKAHRSPKLAMRDGNYKLLMNPDGSQVMLFNLEKDLGEKTNLALQVPEQVSQMKPQLLKWWQEMNMYFMQENPDISGYQ
ncbi:sulfatase-like hydrolase/transferase [Catenovulum adriaticum]|uniref:Sulfatase-like hydrolase/transferase n=1 Tax=Catenovulum adriaticum TaxID=2984846 RepID=A0ABY7ARP4_9ALTE|nr:sulfatase-like hydrolase/transferase [Catenovulum sp. TS8]WAJ71796.1 sulfatase-like hydrolase/transferase [Catenovulum sp. TS8]